MCGPGLILKPLFYSLVGFVSLFCLLEFLSAIGHFSAGCDSILKVGPYALECCDKRVGFQCQFSCDSDKMPLSAIGHLIRRAFDFVLRKN